MRWTIIFPVIAFAVLSVAQDQIDSDHDGMPDLWERKFGLNPTNATDAHADPDQDGFVNLEEFRAGTDPGGSDLPCIDYKLGVEKVVAKGTNLWIRFLQFGGRPVWVREGEPDGPVGGVPDWNNRKLWKRISHVAVDDSIPTNIQVLVIFEPQDGETNMFSVPFLSGVPREIVKGYKKERANTATNGADK